MKNSRNTRGKDGINETTIHAFIETLEVPAEDKGAYRPHAAYIGARLKRFNLRIKTKQDRLNGVLYSQL